MFMDKKSNKVPIPLLIDIEDDPSMHLDLFKILSSYYKTPSETILSNIDIFKKF